MFFEEDINKEEFVIDQFMWSKLSHGVFSTLLLFKYLFMMKYLILWMVEQYVRSHH